MQRFQKEEYAKYTQKRAGRSPWRKNMVLAFLIGGGICLLGQILFSLYATLISDEETASRLVTISLIFLSALLTFFGVFDRIARFAGAGTLVPVTGFANAVVAPAMDNKSEGFIMGVGAKMFIVAGPVLVYGVLSGALVGVVEWVVGLFQG